MCISVSQTTQDQSALQSSPSILTFLASTHTNVCWIHYAVLTWTQHVILRTDVLHCCKQLLAVHCMKEIYACMSVCWYMEDCQLHHAHGTVENEGKRLLLCVVMTRALAWQTFR